MKYRKLKKYIRKIRNQYIESKGKKGCTTFQILTTENEIIIYPTNKCENQIRLKF